MTEEQLRELCAQPAPGEEEAGERSLGAVQAAYTSREPGRARRRMPVRAALALAACAAIAAVAVTPPGRAVLGRLRDAVGRERVTPSRPALVSLPAPGRLLVLSARGPWIVRQDGSKRLLGAYDDASWSPHGLFVVATRGRSLVALTPAGVIRWSLSRKPVTRPRWSPDGFRIAYRSGRSLRVVAGDGTGDRLVARKAGPAAPAWRPGPRHVLAWADRAGRVHVVDTDTRKELWRTKPGPPVRELEWTRDGRRLQALAGRDVVIYRASGRPFTGIRVPHGAVLDIALRPGTHEAAYAFYSPATRKTTVASTVSGRLFSGAGRLRDLTWSPDGRWLLLAWPAADQLIFVRVADRKIVAVSNVAREFDPGGIGPVAFPRLAGWCCPEGSGLPPG